MQLDQKVARAPEINPLNITNDEKQKENRDADQFFSILLVKLLFSFHGVDEVEVPEGRILAK